jgi:hypothetical protein
MRVYLDCCCLNRPYDDLRQERVRIEAEAVCSVIRRIEEGSLELVSSNALLYEVGRNPFAVPRERSLRLLGTAKVRVASSPALTARTAEIVARGFSLPDAAHIASAEAARPAVFLTVDDRLLRRAANMSDHLLVKVASPASWLFELEER